MWEHLDLILTGFGLLATFWGITWKLGESMDKKLKEHSEGHDKKQNAFKDEMNKKIMELALLHEKGFNRVYERFDEYKKRLEETHVRKEVCEVMHAQLCQDMNEVKTDVKELLKRARNGKESHS